MYILFDIGGTKTRVAITTDLQTLAQEPVVFDTKEDLAEEITAIQTAARELAGEQNLLGAAGGMKGSFDRKAGRTVRVPGKNGWDNQPIIDMLETALGVRPHILNDTALVGLGEAHFGAGQGSEILVYVTVSTGVGGVRIVNGKVDVAHFGFEVGHQIIDIDGTACVECNAQSRVGSGRLEEYVGGAAFTRRTGKNPREVTDKTVWDEEARLFAAGLHNIVVHWSPDTVVLGGSMIEGIHEGGPGITPEDTAKHLKDVLWIFPEIPTIKKATLGATGGLFGAMVLLRK
jgi:glucokinase